MVNPMSVGFLLNSRDIYPAASDLQIPTHKRKEIVLENDPLKKQKNGIVKPNPDLTKKKKVNSGYKKPTFTLEMDYKILTLCLKDGVLTGVEKIFEDLAVEYKLQPLTIKRRLYTLKSHMMKDSSTATLERIDQFLEGYHKNYDKQREGFSKTQDETILRLYQKGVDDFIIAQAVGKGLASIKYRIATIVAQRNEQVVSLENK